MSGAQLDGTAGDHYRIIHFIGRGSCGQCKLAEDLRTNRLVVIKEISLTTCIPASQLRSGDINPGEKLKAALNEVNLLQAVKHPNVIAYFESWLEETQNSAVLHMPGWTKSNCRTVVFEQTVSIVMEFAAGGELNAEIIRRRQGTQETDTHANDYVRNTPRYAEKVFKNRRGPFAIVDVWLIFIQILSALKYVHSNRILHRDIKSRNIFITSEGVIKLGDFGIARQLKDDMAKTLVGSPYFMAPEIHKQQPYDERSDLWSLGCVLFQICTFTNAFRGESLDEIHRDIMAYDADVPKAQTQWRSLLINNYPNPADSEHIEGLLEVISQLLSINPANRPSVTQLFALPAVLKGYEMVVENFSESLYPQFAHIHNYWKTSVSRKVQHLARLKRATSQINYPHTARPIKQSAFAFRRSGSSNVAGHDGSSGDDEEQVFVRRRKKATITTKVVKTIRRKPLSEGGDAEGVVRVVTVEKMERTGEGKAKKTVAVVLESPNEETPIILRIRKRSRRLQFEQAKVIREQERGLLETQLLTALRLLDRRPDGPLVIKDAFSSREKKDQTLQSTESSAAGADMETASSFDLSNRAGGNSVAAAGRSPARPPVGPTARRGLGECGTSPHQRAVSHAFALHGLETSSLRSSPKRCTISRKSVSGLHRETSSTEESVEVDVWAKRKVSASADSTVESRRVAQSLAAGFHMDSRRRNELARSRLGPTRVSLTNSRLSKLQPKIRDEEQSNSSAGSITLRPIAGSIKALKRTRSLSPPPALGLKTATRVGTQSRTTAELSARHSRTVSTRVSPSRDSSQFGWSPTPLWW